MSHFHRRRLDRVIFACGVISVLGGCRGDPPSDNPAGVGGGSIPPGDLCINEILYHPVMEDSIKDVHEFVEIYNRGDDAIPLGGMKMRGGADFDFPSRSLGPGEYLVIAKNRQALLALDRYAIDPDAVVGDYDGTLSNGGESLRIEADDGSTIDSVDYDDGFPWPIAADGLGVGEDWLPAELLPLERHQHGGRSLERVSCATASNNPGAWVASALDGATPGGENPSMAEAAPVVVIGREANPVGSGGPILETDAVEVSIALSGEESAPLTLEYFVDELGVDSEPVLSVALAGTSRVRTAELPPQTSNSIIRYRVLADRGLGPEVISPRPSDPYQWHAYFVDPGLSTDSKVFHLFVDPENWTKMWDFVESGRERDCDVNPTWQERVPATFVFDGEVFDVQVRYQGSRWNRTNGPEVFGFDGVGPSRPSPLRGLSYRIGFPRYHRMEDRRVAVLNKLTQSCPGFSAIVGFQLFRDAGLLAPSASFARLQINGAYYRYVADLERVDEDLLNAHHEATDGEDVGHLFKASGLNGDAGPYGWGNGSLLAESCGFSETERYEYTYPRKTHDFAGHEPIISMLEGLHQARDSGDVALRSYLETTFDVDWMITYYSVINYMAPFDDSFHNYYYYQRLSDQKWILIPWDLDLTFGGMLSWDTSLFVGVEGEPDAFDGWWNVVKDSFLTTYANEYLARIKELNRGILSAERVKAMLEDAHAQGNWMEAGAAPGGVDCNPDEALVNMSNFVDARSGWIEEWTSTPN